MKSKIVLLMTALAMLVGAPTALAETEDTTGPEADTRFEASLTLTQETAYIQYRVCTLNGDDCGDPPVEIELVANEEGEINHGTIVSAIVKAIKEAGYRGAGCLIRHVAQSDWGKDGALNADIDVETACGFDKRGGQGSQVDDDDKNGQGRPAWAGQGKPPWAGPDGDKSLKPGKSNDSDD